MCGIVGYVGARDAAPIILEGLRRLEYRGYDSAGMALIDQGEIHIRRDAGKLQRLASLLADSPVQGLCGIGHTRWATHGVPDAINAHPHLSHDGEVVVVHNGIVENYLELKQALQQQGIDFQSATDTEVIVQQVACYLQQGLDLREAGRRCFKRLQGANVVLLMQRSQPQEIVCARLGHGGALVVGLGEDGHFLASDLPAILEHTRRVVFLDAGEMAVITPERFSLEDLQGSAIEPQSQLLSWDPSSAEKGEYRHFMQKEIFEQVRALGDTLSGRVDFDSAQVQLPELNLSEDKARQISRIVITGCGTAAYAGMVGKVLIESLARIPVEVMIASELRYCDPILDERTVLLAISQSGETADTLAAMQEARKKGATLWAIVNAIGSQAMRMADGCIGMQTGPEIGVASTKAFTAPLLDLYMLALVLAQLRGTLDGASLRAHVSQLRLSPELADRALACEEQVKEIALQLKDMHSCLYLGRGVSMPIAYEGALKLKELTYIHAEGYPAGEIKHGPIALIDEQVPVVCIAPRDLWRDKMVSHIQQVQARGGRVLALYTEGDTEIAGMADWSIALPACPWPLSPIVSVIPLQLLAYHIAAIRGLDVDQPRNLAKSVTVE